MSWSGPPGQPGPSGPDGLYNPPAVGIPSPQSVEKIEVIKLQWEYIQGGQLMSRVEIWLDNV